MIIRLVQRPRLCNRIDEPSRTVGECKIVSVSIRTILLYCRLLPLRASFFYQRLLQRGEKSCCIKMGCESRGQAPLLGVRAIPQRKQNEQQEVGWTVTTQE